MNQSDLSFALLRPCMAMTERGLGVDKPLQQERIKTLSVRAEALQVEAQLIVQAVREKLKKPHLFFHAKRCKCCGGGKVRATHCWTCGPASAYPYPKNRVEWGTLAGLLGKIERKYSIKALQSLLAPCRTCEGTGKTESFTFNLGSNEQLKDVLYKALRLPVRSEKGRVTTNEQALESLLTHDTTGLVRLALRYAKLSTMHAVYQRITPAADGRVRTVFNPAGTYTGRFSSAEAFYVDCSTNLQNLVAAEATRDPLFAVRDCIVPTRGQVLLYADLSQAEARVSAACAHDTELLARWENPAWDCHRWTAAQLAGKDEAAVTQVERDLDGKMPRHALNYGMGPKKYWREVNAHAGLTGLPGITQAQAQARWEAYHALHPKLEIWWDVVEQQLHRTSKIVATHCGWVCNFYPKFDPATGHLDVESLKAGIAWEPQHTVAHVLNEGLLELWNQESEMQFRVLHQAHDAVLGECAPRHVGAVAKRWKKVLERPIVVHGHALVIPAEVFVCKERWSTKERVL